MMLSVVNISIVNIALPAMAKDLDSDVGSVGWVVTGFLVTQATLLPVAGRAGDLYGRRRVFVAGTLVLCVTSLLCAVAWSVGSLITFRILQGVGASVMAPTAFSYAAELFAPAERAQALGVLGGIMGLAPVLALNLAGVLVAGFGWRSVFLFTPVLGALVLAGAMLILMETPRRPRVRFDLPGAALAAVGLFGVLVALSRGEAWGWTSAAVIGSGLVGACSLAAFVVREQIAVAPMIDLSLFRLRSLTTANLAAAASSAALFGMLILLPFYFTAIRGFGPVALAMAITPIAGSFMLISPISGRLVSRGVVGSSRLATLGFGVSALGAVWMALAADRQSYWAVLPGMIAMAAGLAAATSPVTLTAISEVPLERLGVASSLPNISRYTGAALGVAATGAVLYSALPAGVGQSEGLVGPAARVAVAEGFRSAAILAAAFLLVAALCASRMPRQASRRADVVVNP